MPQLKREAVMTMAASDLAAVLTAELCNFGLLGGMEVWRVTQEGVGRFRLDLAPKNAARPSVVDRPEGPSIQAQGGQARKAALSPERRSEIARHAAGVRWNRETRQ